MDGEYGRRLMFDALFASIGILLLVTWGLVNLAVPVASFLFWMAHRDGFFEFPEFLFEKVFKGSYVRAIAANVLVVWAVIFIDILLASALTSA